MLPMIHLVRSMCYRRWAGWAALFSASYNQYAAHVGFPDRERDGARAAHGDLVAQHHRIGHKVRGPGSNLADHTLLEVTANSELIIAAGSATVTGSPN